MKNDALRQEFENKRRFYRIVAGVAVVSCLYNVSLLDKIVQNIYASIVNTWWFKHDSFEPVWATASFGTWIIVFNIIDFYFPKRFEKYLIHPKGRSSDDCHQAYLALPSAIAYLVPILIYDYYVPRRTVPQTAPSFLRLIGGIATGIFFYDLFFFPIHYLFHKGPEYFRGLHKRHHEASPLCGKDVIRHSIIDGSMQVITNITVLNLLKLPPFTRMIYNTVITYMLTEIHSGYDMPWMLHNILPKGILGGPNRHELHHKTGRVNYHQFFTYFDNYLGIGADT